MATKVKRAAVLRPAQIWHLLRATEATSRFPERDAVILLLGFTVGMRISEIAQITIADVLFSNGRLRVEVSLREAVTKGCRQRTVYFTSQNLIDAIERYLAHRVERGLGTTLDNTRCRGLHPSLPVVLSRKGYPYSLNRKVRTSATGEQMDYWAADTLQSYVTKLYQEAGLKGASSHSGRRSYASRLIYRGATVEQVSLLLGHQS
ncbi:site-specific integrase [Paraburkholderia unamae]|uniref:Site-specific integrase n=1 Tax=Paraburkholderia unamae TaxID=219649 RepID=A0ACC6RXN7_9BURK